MTVKGVISHEVLIDDYCRILKERALNVLEHKDEINREIELLKKMQKGFSHNESDFKDKA
jgi:hypothetical protein